MDCERVLVAAPTYLEARGEPQTGAGPDRQAARLPDAALSRRARVHWTLTTPAGPQKFEVHGPFDSDDGDVLTGWALSGRGIINKPRFEVAVHLAAGALVPVCRATAAPAGAVRRRLPAQEAAGPQGPPAARLHGRRLPARARRHPRRPATWRAGGLTAPPRGSAASAARLRRRSARGARQRGRERHRFPASPRGHGYSAASW